MEEFPEADTVPTGEKSFPFALLSIINFHEFSSSAVVQFNLTCLFSICAVNDSSFTGSVTRMGIDQRSFK